LFVFKDPETKKAFLAEQIGKGKNAKLKRHFLLVKSSTIIGKGYLVRALREAQPVIDEILGHHLDLSIGGTK